MRSMFNLITFSNESRDKRWFSDIMSLSHWACWSVFVRSLNNNLKS
jgi:hypothetical protein